MRSAPSTRAALGLALLSCAAALGLAAPAAHALTYQVGPGRMYTNLGAVASRLAPGDIVEVDGGNTYPGGVRFTVPGTPAMPITIRGMRAGGAARPVLSGGTNTVELAGNNYVLEGFDITGGTSRCVFHHADNITIRDSVVHDCPRQGILGADADSGDLLLEYVEVHHCGGGTQDHQIYMATDERAYPGSVFRMQFCYVHDANGGNSVKSRAERNEIYYNWIEGALYHELELIGIDPGGGGDPALAREDSDVVGNVLFKRNTFAVVRFGGDGTGASRGRYRFVNNTVVIQPGGSAVFRLFDDLESVEAHNNAFVRFSGTGGVLIMRNVEARWTAGREVFTGANNWVPTGSMMLPAGWTGTVMGTDPRVTNPMTNQLRPLAGSPLVNAGVASTTSPAGFAFPRPLALPLYEPPQRALIPPGSAAMRTTPGGVDIGALELGGSVPGGDAGPMTDASVPPVDSGTTSDAGVISDAAGPTDAGGTGSDGAVMDSGTSSGGDGGRSDSGTSGGSDAARGDVAGDAGGGSRSGCGCRAAGGGDAGAPRGVLGALAAVSALAALTARRRRRRATA